MNSVATHIWQNTVGVEISEVPMEGKNLFCIEIGAGDLKIFLTADQLCQLRFHLGNVEAEIDNNERNPDMKNVKIKVNGKLHK